MKTSWRYFCKRSWRRLENALKTFLQDVLKTYSHDKYTGLDQDVLKKSWRRLRRSITKANIFVLIKTSWWRLLKTKTKDVFKTSSKRLHQEECLVGINHSIDFLNEFVLGINNQNLPFQTYRKSVYTGLLLNFASFT